MGLISIALSGLVLLFSRDAQAQLYDFYYYWDGAQYQQYSPQYDLYSEGNTNQYPEQLYDPIISYTFCTISYICRNICRLFTAHAVLAESLSFRDDTYQGFARGDQHQSVLCHE